MSCRLRFVAVCDTAGAGDKYLFFD